MQNEKNHGLADYPIFVNNFEAIKKALVFNEDTILNQIPLIYFRKDKRAQSQLSLKQNKKEDD